MPTNILFKRGTNTNLNALSLKPGEPAFVTNLGKLYVGDGTNKILINPIDKPVGLNLINFYSKVKVNDYGQVTSQSNLVADDIPFIPTTKITGLGTAAITNTGTSAGNIPILDATGKISSSILPLVSTVGYAHAYYLGSDSVIVPPGTYVPLNGFISSNSNHFSINSNGVITVNLAGAYLITYNISTQGSLMNTTLGAGDTVNWNGSASRSSATAVPAIVSTGASIIRNIVAPPEKYGIKNNGTNNLSLLSACGSITITKIN